MSTNEQEVIVDETNEEKVVEAGVETSDETAEENKGEKRKYTPEEQLSYHEGIAKRLRKDLGLNESEEKPTKKASQKSDEPDYGKLSYLESKGISDSEDQDYLLGLSKDSKIELKDLLKKSWVQSELKERKELKTSSNAIPKNDKRSGGSSQDTVEYWLAKGELPPVSNRGLREKVVEAKMQADKNKKMFYNG